MRHDHPHRRNPNDFGARKRESSDPPGRLTGDELWDEIWLLSRIIETGSQVRFSGYGEYHNWTKRRIFWDLPYWKDNLVQHNLDIMHIEKNVFDNVFHTVMDNKDRTKDNERSRLDIAQICHRPGLQLEPIGNGRYVKPKATYCLTQLQNQAVCEWVHELKMPDGYASNIARCLDFSNARLVSMKGHDCHVFMQRLLPVALAALPENVLNPIIELSIFFWDLCSTELSVDQLMSL